MQAMEYHIISGNVIETCRSFMSASRQKKRRGIRIAGNTSMRKILANEREQIKRLARILNANFADGLIFATLKQDNSFHPKDLKEAKIHAAKYLRKLRAAGVSKYVLVAANWSPKRDCAVNIHYHIVFPADTSLDLIVDNWPIENGAYIERRGAQRDLSTLAAYLVANVHDDAGAKAWSCSQNLAKPIYTEPVPVNEVDNIQVLPDTFVIEAAPSYDEDGAIRGSYMRAYAYYTPEVRGNMVKIRKAGRKRKSDTEFNLALHDD